MDRKKLNARSGQAITEYVLLLAMVVGLYSLLLKGLTQSGMLDRLKTPLEKDFKYTYQYGHPKARGQGDDGGPKYIPQLLTDGKTDPDFRIFINPPIK
jgi:hypothetical protein